MGCPRSLSLLAACTGAIFLTSGCATSSIFSRAPAEPAEAQPRTELVLLNVSESSGWVAYACEKEHGDEVEEYRIVVLRTRTGEVIYDSTVPLASNLCTHGFEMDANDPRLRRMAQSVDRDLITPLESFQNSQGGASAEPPPAPPRPPSPPPPAQPPNAPEAAFSLVSRADDGTLTLQMTAPGTLQPGQRLFARAPDRVISLAGLEDPVVTRGEITGMLEVVSVDGSQATARRLSGEIPDNAVFLPPESP